MALINCPECGKEVSDKAEDCQNCGYPLKGIDKRKKLINNNFVCLGCLVLFVVFFSIYVLFFSVFH